MNPQIKHQYIDDVKAISVKTYIKKRLEAFAELREDFSALSDYETMLMFSLSYPKEEVPFKGKGYGNVSRYSYGLDYHQVYQQAFKDLEATLDSQGIKAKGYADISPIDERFAAHLAGLGYLGKNQFLIHPTFGTYHFIGVMLIDTVYETEPYAYDTCGDCTKCIDACPPGALDHGFDKRKCTSYVTQAKEALDMCDLRPLKTKLFGCDICQKVCPKNQAITPVFHDVFTADDHAQLNLTDLLTMSNKAIQKAYKNYAFGFRGGLVLKRNAMALLMNQGVMDALPLMKQVYNNYKHVDWFEQTAKLILNAMEE